jgi:hypothetical protein
MQVSTLAHDYPEAIRHAQAILDRDTLREDVHRELMRLFMLNGQRAMALHQFEVCRAALHKELVIEPMRETVAVYQRIADSAVEHSGEPNLRWEVRSAPVMEPGSKLSLRELVGRAHWYLSQADARLRKEAELP